MGAPPALSQSSWLGTLSGNACNKRSTHDQRGLFIRLVGGRGNSPLYDPLLTVEPEGPNRDHFPVRSAANTSQDRGDRRSAGTPPPELLAALPLIPAFIPSFSRSDPKVGLARQPFASEAPWQRLDRRSRPSDHRFRSELNSNLLPDSLRSCRNSAGRSATSSWKKRTEPPRHDSLMALTSRFFKVFFQVSW